MKLIQDALYLYPIFRKKKNCMNNGTGPCPTNHDVYEAEFKTEKRMILYIHIRDRERFFEQVGNETMLFVSSGNKHFFTKLYWTRRPIFDTEK